MGTSPRLFPGHALLILLQFQNARSRRINTLPKRSCQQPSRKSLASPPQTANTMTSLHEVEQHLRTMTDSPLAQHVTLPDSKDPYHQLRLPTPPPFKSTLRAVEDNSGMVSSREENNRNDELIDGLMPGSIVFGDRRRGRFYRRRASKGWQGELSE